MTIMEDWARGGCLSKGLLDCLAGGRNLGVNLYARYMEETTLIDNDLSFTGLSRFGLVNRTLLKDVQYKLAAPQEEPAHWSIFSECDVNRVGNLLELQIIMYAYEPSPGERIPHTTTLGFWSDKLSEGSASRRLWIWHDPRANCQLRSKTLQTKIFIVTPKMIFCASNDLGELLDARSHVWFSDIRGPAEETCLSVDSFDGDYLAAVDEILGLNTPHPESSTSQESERREEKITSLRDFFLCDRHSLHKRWAAASPCVVLLSYTRKVGNVLSRSSRSMARAGQLRFTCLAITSELSKEDSRRDFADHAVPEAAVVCFYGPRRFCLLQDPFRSAALALHLDTRGLAQKLLNRSDLSGVPRTLDPAVVREARAKKREENSGGEKKKKKKKKIEVAKKCACKICKSEKYQENMASAGPERLCTVPYTLSDLLQMLGALDDKSRGLISQMVHLSVASMDIESQTINVDLEGPRPGPLVEYPTFGGPTLEGHVVKTQRPVMIGHTDALSRERREKWFDVVSNDSPEAVYAMFSRYWLRVTRLAREARAEKKKISQELFELSSKYKEAYLAFAQSWVQLSTIERDYHHRSRLAEIHQMLAAGNCLDPDTHKELTEEADRQYLNSEDWAMPQIEALVSAFRNTLPGLLEARLRQLIRRYVVFSFYG